MNTYSYRTFEVDTTSKEQTAIVRFESRTTGPEGTEGVSFLSELGDFFSRLRGDNSVRVAVITGKIDGEFSVALPRDFNRGKYVDPKKLWRSALGLHQIYNSMIEIEKPIVARLNGDALGLGQALMLASDIIIAREEALITDIHLAMGETIPSYGGNAVGPPFGVPPGDGGGALLPLFMTPTKLKEHLMLSTVHSAKDLEEAGIINHAVPLEQLDELVDDVVDRLLARSAYALAVAKRIANRHMAQQLNLALDASIAYQFLSLSEQEQITDQFTL